MHTVRHGQRHNNGWRRSRGRREGNAKPTCHAHGGSDREGDDKNNSHEGWEGFKQYQKHDKNKQIHQRDECTHIDHAGFGKGVIQHGNTAGVYLKLWVFLFKFFD